MTLPAAARSSVPRSANPDEHWAERGRAIAEKLSASRWALGDWALDIPDGVDDLEAERLTGLLVSAMRSCRWLSRKFPPARRRADVSYSHHIEVAGLPTDVADEMLERAAGEGLTVAGLRIEVRRAKARRAVDEGAEAAGSRDAAAREWSVEQGRTERECDQLLTEAAVALQRVEDALEALGAHPQLALVHGNRLRAAHAHLRARIAPIAEIVAGFPARAERRLADLLKRGTT